MRTKDAAKETSQWNKCKIEDDRKNPFIPPAHFPEGYKHRHIDMSPIRHKGAGLVQITI